MNPTEFLSQSEDVKTSYLCIMAAISSADHSNSPEEIAFMEQMGAVAGLSDSAKAEITNALKNTASVDLQGHINKFKGNQLRFALVSDILSLAFKDGDMSGNEAAQVRQIASQLDISNEQFDALLKYVESANEEAKKTNGNALMDANGQPKQPSGDFLEKIGLKGVFDKLGIPVGQFINGTTITAALSTVAFFVVQNYMKGGNQAATNQQAATNPLGGALSGIIGSFLGGGANPAQTSGGSGLGGMLASMVGSPTGQAAISGILNNFMQSNGQGQGLAGSLIGMFAGGATQQQGQAGGAQMLQNVMNMFFKK
jgi:uncharacterized tellurite resistance protein B-like protein